MNKVQVGFLMSYDYKLLKNSIPLVYDHADTIFIALDKEFRTWTGDSFSVEEEFFRWLENFDKDHKIKIYQDDFFDSELDPMQNEVRERKMLASKMGVGNWLVQVDSDEYFINFEEFVRELRSRNKYLKNPERNKIQIAGFYINLYKYTEDGILYVSEVRNQKFATNYPNYVTGRNTKERVVYIPNIVIHECLSRSEEEIRTKFENWGHSHQVNIDGFLKKWKKVNRSNYRNFQNFFYLEPEKWKKLDFVPGENIESISKKLIAKNIEPKPSYLAKKNFGQWFKFLFR